MSCRHSLVDDALVIFLAVVLTTTALIHLYLWKRLVRDTTTPGRWRRIGTWAVVGAVAVLLGGLFSGWLVPVAVSQYFAWPAYVWLGLMFYLLVTLLVLELPRLALWLAWARREPTAQPAVAEPALVPAGTAAGAGGWTEERLRAAGETGPRSEERSDEWSDEWSGAVQAAWQARSPRERSERRRDSDEGSRRRETPGSAPAEPAPVNSARRLLLARTLAIAAGVTATGTVGYGMTQALGRPELDRVRIPLAKLPQRMDGLRIALVADIHLGALRGRGHTERVVNMINEVDADVVAVVGDLVDGTVEELGAAAAPLRRLRSRYGSYFVTGNHEYFSGYAPWLEELGELGLRVLQNERVEIDGLDLAGVNDIVGGQYQHGPDFGRALGDRDPAKPVILLAHQPVQVHEAARHGVDLQLSGHTHGGQIQPFGAIVRLVQPVLTGLATVDGTQVYVTNGAGFWGPPVRVGAPAQISVVELRAS